MRIGFVKTPLRAGKDARGRKGGGQAGACWAPIVSLVVCKRVAPLAEFCASKLLRAKRGVALLHRTGERCPMSVSTLDALWRVWR